MYSGRWVLSLWWCFNLLFTHREGFAVGEGLIVSGPQHGHSHSQMEEQPQRRPLAGGWAEARLDDPMVLEVADFLFQTLLKEASPRYSFLATVETTGTDSERDASTYTTKVIQATQQVVAGMNFQLTLLVQSASNQECLGGFSATVYNHFGDLSVMDWRDELTCAEANVLMEEIQAGDPGDQ